MTDVDYYKLLKIKKDADKKTIKKAYRRQARKYHPDINKSKNAEKKFKLLTEAYAVLSDDKKRKEYDLNGYKRMKKYSQSDLILTVDLNTLFKAVKIVSKNNKIPIVRHSTLSKTITVLKLANNILQLVNNKSVSSKKRHQHRHRGNF